MIYNVLLLERRVPFGIEKRCQLREPDNRTTYGMNDLRVLLDKPP